MKVTLRPQDYFEILYPNGEETQWEDQPCPVCGKTLCWDMENNDHKGITENIYYECNCGAKWIEHWACTKVELVIPGNDNE